MRFLLLLCMLSSCYASHERPSTSDAGRPRDGGRRDAGPAGSDAGPLRCNRLAIPPGVALRNDDTSAVTPRIVALDRGETGVVYVLPGIGSPTGVVYERLSRSLDRLTGPVTVTDDSFTWAEPVVLGDELAIAHGLAGAQSALHHLDFDGTRIRPRDRVAVHYPTILRASESGIFWAAFRMEGENALDVVHVAANGELLHPVQSIVLGRYGSGHGAARVGASHVLGYPREGPRGVRNGYVRALNGSGVLDDERALGDDGDNVVLPVVTGGELVLVRRNDDALVLERADPATLERLDRRSFPTTTLAPIAAAIGGRLVVAHVEDGSLVVDDHGRDLGEPVRYEASLPAAFGTGMSIAEVPGAAVIALGLNEGSTSFPWVVRIECAP